MMKIRTFNDLLLARERNLNHVIRKEYRMRELTANLKERTHPSNLGNELIAGLLERPEIIVRTGMIVYSIIREIRSSRRY